LPLWICASPTKPESSSQLPKRETETKNYWMMDQAYALLLKKNTKLPPLKEKKNSNCWMKSNTELKLDSLKFLTMLPKEVNKTHSKLKAGKTKTEELMSETQTKDGDLIDYHDI